eukprot:CAMPEP_0201113948 /NCGR_PEP_ID=MMETSP0812-20130820/78123_1 /ASSEMBLY_ACC=CAM_ASM_000668 /TAXON_ID=98059 /ORGANISM="Dinobryon sp., Strain UTEXLB2267" /LENGTH=772 /DNA_ID=CAMNT_0047377531 /DNA_START=69 /DNA_END=2387 /DNA_ORIENTATION=-
MSSVDTIGNTTDTIATANTTANTANSADTMATTIDTISDTTLSDQLRALLCEQHPLSSPGGEHELRALDHTLALASTLRAQLDSQIARDSVGGTMDSVGNTMDWELAGPFTRLADRAELDLVTRLALRLRAALLQLRTLRAMPVKEEEEGSHSEGEEEHDHRDAGQALKDSGRWRQVLRDVLRDQARAVQACVSGLLQRDDDRDWDSFSGSPAPSRSSSVGTLPGLAPGGVLTPQSRMSRSAVPGFEDTYPADDDQYMQNPLIAGTHTNPQAQPLAEQHSLDTSALAMLAEQLRDERAASTNEIQDLRAQLQHASAEQQRSQVSEALARQEAAQLGRQLEQQAEQLRELRQQLCEQAGQLGQLQALTATHKTCEQDLRALLASYETQLSSARKVETVQGSASREEQEPLSACSAPPIPAVTSSPPQQPVRSPLTSLARVYGELTLRPFFTGTTAETPDPHTASAAASAVESGFCVPQGLQLDFDSCEGPEEDPAASSEPLGPSPEELTNQLQAASAEVSRLQGANQQLRYELAFKAKLLANANRSASELLTLLSEKKEAIRGLQTQLALLGGGHVTSNAGNMLLCTSRPISPLTEDDDDEPRGLEEADEGLYFPTRRPGDPVLQEAVPDLAGLGLGQDPDQRALQHGLLLSLQTARYGTDMVTSLTPDFEPVVAEYVRRGCDREQAALLIFEERFGKVALPCRPLSPQPQRSPQQFPTHLPAALSPQHLPPHHTASPFLLQQQEEEIQQIVSRGYSYELAAQIYFKKLANKP